MEFSLSVDAQEFVPGNGFGSSSKIKLGPSLSVDAPVFVPVVSNDPGVSEPSVGKVKNKLSAVQRRGRFAQVDCRGNSNKKSVDLSNGPTSSPVKKKENCEVGDRDKGQSNIDSLTENRISKGTADKNNLKQSFSLEYSKRRKQLTSSFDEKVFIDENKDILLNKHQHNLTYSSGESKPIILWSSIVKKEPDPTDYSNTDKNVNLFSKQDVQDENPKKYSKNKVTRTKNVLSESTNEKFQRNLDEKKRRDLKRDEDKNKKTASLDILSRKSINCNLNDNDNLDTNPLSKTTSIPRNVNKRLIEKTSISTTNCYEKSSERVIESDDVRKIRVKKEASSNISLQVPKHDILITNKKENCEHLNKPFKTNDKMPLVKKKKNLVKLPNSDNDKLKKLIKEKQISKEKEFSTGPPICKEIKPELVDLDLLDNSTFPALAVGKTTSQPFLSYSAVTKKVLTVDKCSAKPTSTLASSASQNILDALNNLKLTEEEKRALRKRQKALKRKMKVKQKKQESKLNPSAKPTTMNTEKVSDKEMTFDLSDMFTKLLKYPIDAKKSQKIAKSKKMKVSTGVISVVSGLAKKNTPDGRRVEKNKYGTTHTLLDGTTIRKRGKERETPKKKRPTLLKKVIQAERERKRALQESKPLSTQTSIKEEELTYVETSNEETVVETVDHISELPEDIWKKIHSKKFREYCDHVLTKDINHFTYNLLVDLQRFQDRVYHENRIKYKQKRRFILGLREVLKHLKLKRLKAVIIAPNIERISAKGGLDDYLGSIISICNEQDIPKIFAMNRHVLGRVVKKLAPVSVVGIFDYDGAHEIFKELIGLVELAKDAYKEKVDKLILEENITDDSTSQSRNVVYQNSNNITNQYGHDSTQIKHQILNKLYFDDYQSYDVENESDWVTDNEGAPL